MGLPLSSKAIGLLPKTQCPLCLAKVIKVELQEGGDVLLNPGPKTFNLEVGERGAGQSALLSSALVEHVCHIQETPLQRAIERVTNPAPIFNEMGVEFTQHETANGEIVLHPVHADTAAAIEETFDALIEQAKLVGTIDDTEEEEQEAPPPPPKQSKATKLPKPRKTVEVKAPQEPPQVPGRERPPRKFFKHPDTNELIKEE